MTQIDESVALSIDIELGGPWEFVSRPAKPKYPAKSHARKVKDELIGLVPRVSTEGGLIFLPGQGTTEFEDSDGEAPFRQRRYAFYLSGANFPECRVTYDIGNDLLTLWVETRDPKQILWYGALPSIEECAARCDVDAVKDIANLQVYLEDVVKTRTVYVLHKDQRPSKLSWESLGRSIDLNTSYLKPAMDMARAVKTDYEVAQIREANRISSEAHRHVQERIKSMTSETQVENAFLAKCRELGGKEQAYGIIAGSGPNTAVLHYNGNDQDFGDRQLILVDAGAEFNCYASDVTRTFPINGQFTPEAKKVYMIVEEMQAACIAMIKPGASWSSISIEATSIALRGLLGLGVLQHGRNGDLPPRTVSSAFFPHGLGHLVGLDTHDVINGVRLQGGGPEVPWVTPLRTNMVITVEPGIYFNKEYINWFFSKQVPELAQYVNMSALEKYYPVGGCRIEDCILVTENGPENLTTAPKGEEMLRVINGK
ncbi:hypothetical protein VMCG_00391 [Cytospora schulzeri]|uniref:Xaa-Pro aminopeptidase n=1 Tax=Cytospora schulzeri TaxID=448051 RepID=A0A423X9V6_9PEZI|nr:hypothetical protein VMCG_00391 [Valsa malicola]